MGWQPAENLFYDYEDVLEHLFLCDFMLNFQNPQENQVFDLHLFLYITCRDKEISHSNIQPITQTFQRISGI